MSAASEKVVPDQRAEYLTDAIKPVAAAIEGKMPYRVTTLYQQHGRKC